MQIVQEIRNITQNALHDIFQQNFAASEIAVNENKTEFEGEYTLVLFGLAKKLSLRPDEIGTMLGEYLKSKHPFITDYNIVKGFLNLVISPQHYD
jgi:arginyl-tRNA synthetase